MQLYMFCTAFCLPFVIASVIVQPRIAAATRAASDEGMALLEPSLFRALSFLSFRPLCYDCNVALTSAAYLYRRLGRATDKIASRAAGNLTQGDPQASSNSTKQLEIVIATYGTRMQQSAHTWEQVLALPKASSRLIWDSCSRGHALTHVWLGADKQVAALLPYVTIYNQDSSGKSSGWLEHHDQTTALLQNGRVIYLDNKGRESHVHLYHIVNNWHSLYR